MANDQHITTKSEAESIPPDAQPIIYTWREYKHKQLTCSRCGRVSESAWVSPVDVLCCNCHIDPND